MKKVETADLEQIVLMVQREAERLLGGRKQFRLGGFHRVAFFLLRAVAYSIPVAMALLLLLIFIGQGGSMPAVVLVLWLLLAVVLLLPLILLNLPLIVAAWRQRRPIVKRDLLLPALPAWQRQARWGVLALTIVAAVLAATVDAFGWSGFSLVLIVVVFPFCLLMMQSFLRLVERNLDLLRSVDKLRGVLEEKLAEAKRESLTEVELSHEVAVSLSDTTDGLLRNQRLRAIDDSMRSRTSQYSVFQSGPFRERLQALEPAVRLQLVDLTQELAVNRRPEGAHQETSGGHWVWPLPDLELDLVYEVADDREQVYVRDARPAGPAGGAGANGPG